MEEEEENVLINDIEKITNRFRSWLIDEQRDINDIASFDVSKYITTLRAYILSLKTLLDSKGIETPSFEEITKKAGLYE